MPVTEYLEMKPRYSSIILLALPLDCGVLYGARRIFAYHDAAASVRQMNRALTAKPCLAGSLAKKSENVE